MTASRQGISYALISLALSLVGLGLLPFLVLSTSPSIAIPWQDYLIGIVFAIICILGIIAGVSPSHCSRRSKPKIPVATEKTEEVSTQASTTHLRKKGHHPTCQHYQGHVLRVRNRVICAGCTGLVTGAILALVGTILFFFGSFRFIFTEVVFWLGWILVALGLLQHLIYHILSIQRGELRVLMNVVFVLGAFLLLASVVQLTNSLVVSGYLLILIPYWIFTRIAMSRQSHHRICEQCEVLDCPFSDG